jgi:hypothetical protein
MTAGAGLGRAGCWNFALRLGMAPVEVDCEGLRSLSSGSVVFIPLDGVLERDDDRDAIRARIMGGGTVVGEGDPDAWSRLLPELFRGRASQLANPYAALGYVIHGRTELIAPPQWPYFTFDAIDGAASPAGNIAAISGERQTPSRALIEPQVAAPALVRWRNLVFLNGAPFHAFQSWLQGQEDLQPWLQWRHRLFFLDEWVAAVKALLGGCDVTLGADPLPIPEFGATAVVLRHDLDYSRDTSYLEAEHAAGIAAVHAVLRDPNAPFWIARLKDHPGHESAFHYNTARYSRALNWLGKRAGRAQQTYRPDRAAVTGAGLLEQVRWARRRGIGIATLHRHLSFLIYPEWIDALDRVLQDEAQVLGGSSLFRGQVLRWGVDRADGGRGTYADFPDAQFPYWFPFKLAHAGDGGRILGGWESASVMEIEPDLVEQMLAHSTPGLPQRVFTFSYHPAHARRPTFAADGSLAGFRRTLDIIRDRQLPVLTLKAVFERLNAFVSEPRAVHPVH